jgi:hypothetical protein
MPKEVERVVDVIAELRGVSSESIARTVHANFLRLTAGDPWLRDASALLSLSER